MLKNIVDELTTKDNLTYSMVKQKLNELVSNETPPQTALYTQANSNHPPQKSATEDEKRKKAIIARSIFHRKCSPIPGIDVNGLKKSGVPERILGLPKLPT
ncbi:hypothetical protein K3495_g6002 [Podosphaera aphanis]|nr:hypothetical protein K3495_g6002 [Podosphaera aphanis]